MARLHLSGFCKAFALAYMNWLLFGWYVMVHVNPVELAVLLTRQEKDHPEIFTGFVINLGAISTKTRSESRI
jgi:hypothetical protein